MGTSERKVEEAPRVNSRMDMDVVEVGEKFYRRHGAVSKLDSWASERMDLLAGHLVGSTAAMSCSSK